MTGLAMLAATLVGGGTLLASQAGASAVLVATLQPPEGLRLHPLARRARGQRHGAPRRARCSSRSTRCGSCARASARCSTGSPRCSSCIADALEHRDARDAERALAAVARLDPQYDHLSETLVRGRRRRAHLAQPPREPDPARPLRGRRRASSGSRSRTRARWPAAPRRAIALDDSIAARGRRPRSTSWPRRRASCHAARGRATPLPRARPRCAPCGSPTRCWRETANLSAVHIVGQVRLVAVDLLRAGGVPRAEAQRRSEPRPPCRSSAPRTSPRRAGSRCRP